MQIAENGTDQLGSRLLTEAALPFDAKRTLNDVQDCILPPAGLAKIDALKPLGTVGPCSVHVETPPNSGQSIGRDPRIVHVMILRFKSDGSSAETQCTRELAALLRRCFRRQLHGLDDLGIGRAAAEIA